MPDIDRIIDATNNNAEPQPAPGRSRSAQARINGARSRGPKTATGKGRACMNALKHGRYAKLATPLEIESGPAYLEIQNLYAERFQPADVVESSLVSELASIDWRLNRCIAVETRTIDLQVRREIPCSDFEAFHLSRLATAIQKLADNGEILDALARRESALVRNRQIVLDTLIRLRLHQPRAERTRIPNPANYIDPETIPESDPTDGATNPETNLIEPGPEPALQEPLAA